MLPIQSMVSEAAAFIKYLSRIPRRAGSSTKITLSETAIVMFTEIDVRRDAIARRRADEGSGGTTMPAHENRARTLMYADEEGGEDCHPERNRQVHNFVSSECFAKDLR
jgi:hypothetical protein